MRREGDGWVRCADGHQHWGLFGAAGLLLVASSPDGAPHVLLQHRAAFSHHGDTWGIPGGAREPQESAEQAAVREASEETGLDPAAVTVLRSSVEDHGGWHYTTVIAEASTLLPVHSEDRESTAVAWVRVEEVDRHVLHPGFGAAWPRVRALLPATGPHGTAGTAGTRSGR